MLYDIDNNDDKQREWETSLKLISILEQTGVLLFRTRNFIDELVEVFLYRTSD